MPKNPVQQEQEAFQVAYKALEEIDKVQAQIQEAQAKEATGFDESERQATKVKKLEAKIKAIEELRDATIASIMGNHSGPEVETATFGLEALKKLRPLLPGEVSVAFLSADRLEITARGKKHHVHCAELELVNRRSGGLNRAGRMLFALAHGTTPADAKDLSQPMKELRRLFRRLLGVKGNPFGSASSDWAPLFKLSDQTNRADIRAKERAVHVTYQDERNFDREDDEAGAWLQKNDNSS